MDRLNPMLEKATDKYEWPKSEAEQDKWVALKMIYKKYRTRYNPALEGQEYSDDEFKAHAGRMWAWYKQHRYGDLKTASQNAAKSYYTDQIFQGLQELETKGGEGGYADEYEVVRKVLGKEYPLSPAVERMVDDAQARHNNSYDKHTTLREKARES